MNNKSDAGCNFVRATYYRNMPEPSDQEKGLPQPPVERPAAQEGRIAELPGPEALDVPPMDLRTAIESRRSLRGYSGASLSLNELSWLLWASQGIRKITRSEGSTRTWRNVPSAGGRHPFETYLVLRAVSGLTPGLYRYLAVGHRIQEVDVSRDYAQKVSDICYRQPFIAQAAATFVWAADAYRSVWRYKARAYRYFYKDSGHVCQNLSLAALPIGCGVCAIGAFDDEELARMIGADGDTLFPVYAAAVGKRAHP